MIAERLSRLSGAQFDQAYAKAMVEDHEEAVALFEAQTKNGRDAAVKEFASKTLPKLRDHLEMARKLPGAGGGANTGSKDKTGK